LPFYFNVERSIIIKSRKIEKVEAYQEIFGIQRDSNFQWISRFSMIYIKVYPMDSRIFRELLRNALSLGFQEFLSDIP